jgi:hypothetical protein
MDSIELHQPLNVLNSMMNFDLLSYEKSKLAFIYAAIE